MTAYDFMIIGAGPAGYTAAIKAAHLHQSVLLCEEDLVGGTCLNVGCIPTKALIHASQYVESITEAEGFGVHLSGTYEPSALQAYKDETVLKLRTGVETLIKANKIELVRGHAKITAAHHIQVNDTDYEGTHILIATGSKPAIPPIEGVNEAGILTSSDLLNPNDHPFNHLCIIGGGVIGCEFANLYANLGKRVTIVEAKPHILPEMDAEISQNLSMLLKRRKVSILTGAGVTKLEPGKVWIGEKCVECDAILMAVGRRSNAEGLFDGDLIEMNRSCIKVDSSFRTNLEEVYACGDCVQGIQLAHYAEACGEWIVETAVNGTSNIHLEAVPACVYLNDEIACVGMTEAQAKEQGITYRIGKYSMLGNSRTVIEKGNRGFVKVLSGEDGTVLGCAMMCSRASDMIMPFVDAVAHRRNLKELSELIYPHPSFCEGIKEALEDTDKDAIHVIYRN